MLPSFRTGRTGKLAALSTTILAVLLGCADPSPATAPALEPSSPPPSVANVAGASLTISTAGASVPFRATGSLAQARVGQTATLLADGRVLVAGGESGEPRELASAELYDPKSGTFGATGSMAQARLLATATRLADGRVLIAGGTVAGLIDGCRGFASAELYDPASGTFSPTGSMATGRQGHTATLLQDGRVLVAGGCSGSPSATGVSAAEIYDPRTGVFSAVGAMTQGRFDHTATLLANGKVLIVGGDENAQTPLASAELFDPATRTFSQTGSMNQSRLEHTATLLPNGRVLVAGGTSISGALAEAELYDPTSGAFGPTGSLNQGSQGHAAVPLADGTVLIVGGRGATQDLARTELYGPATGTFTTAASMSAGRFEHTATLLAGGSVLVVGGDSSGGPLASAELFGP